MAHLNYTMSRKLWGGKEPFFNYID